MESSVTFSCLAEIKNEKGKRERERERERDTHHEEAPVSGILRVPRLDGDLDHVEVSEDAPAEHGDRLVVAPAVVVRPQDVVQVGVDLGVAAAPANFFPPRLQSLHRYIKFPPAPLHPPPPPHTHLSGLMAGSSSSMESTTRTKRTPYMWLGTLGVYLEENKNRLFSKIHGAKTGR